METTSAPTQRTSGLRDAVNGALVPFLASRIALLAVAQFSQALPLAQRWTTAAPGEDRAFAPIFLLDVWGRWDTRWYLELALHGYRPDPLFTTHHSALAFFPLYPALMRAVLAVFPTAARGPALALAVGVAISNAAALGAVLLLHRHVRSRLGPEVAARTVWALLAFPTAFFLSCAYTEALFLLLAVAAFHFAWSERWPGAGAAGFLLALCRPNGLLVALPLGWLALSRRRARGGRATAVALACAALPVLAFAAWALYLARLTGDPLAIGHAQAPWARGLAAPWTTLFRPRFIDRMVDVDRGALLLACAGAVLAFRRLSAADGILAVAFLAPALCSGLLMSGARFALVLFPAFVALAATARGGALAKSALFVAVAFQAALFTVWCRMGWVG